ncbi:MAG: hypothetical protein ACYCVD_17915 [Desulfitobacteriaceae bacterium]
MNKAIASKDAFISQDIYRGLEKIEEEYTLEQFGALKEELQSLVHDVT